MTIIAPYVNLQQAGIARFAGVITTFTSTTIVSALAAGKMYYCPHLRFALRNNGAGGCNAHILYAGGAFFTCHLQSLAGESDSTWSQYPHPFVIDADSDIVIVTAGTGNIVLNYEIWLNEYTP